MEIGPILPSPSMLSIWRLSGSYCSPQYQVLVVKGAMASLHSTISQGYVHKSKQRPFIGTSNVGTSLSTLWIDHILCLIINTASLFPDFLWYQDKYTSLTPP